MKEKETDQTTTGKPKRRARWRHHVVVTLLAVTIMTLFAIITIKVDYLAPVKRALAGFSFTDVYYQIETEGSDPDTCRYITIVDLTRVTERGQIAKVLRDIEAAHPKVIGMDCVFEGEGEDMEGNNAIVEVAEQYKNIVFAKKLQDWKGDSVGYTKATRSFFADFVDITEGTVNMPRLLYDNMKRKYPLAERYKGKQFPSFIAQLSNRYADRDLVKGRTDDININFSPTAFRVLQPEEVKSHPELIEGQIVLFGSVYEEVDMHWTPVGKIAGVELLAYSIQSLVEQKEIHKVSGAAFWIISLLIVLLIEVMQSRYLDKTKHSPNEFVRYVASSPYVMNILTYLFTTVFIGASFVVFSKYHVSFNLAWALSTIAFLGLSRNMYNSLRDYFQSIKDKHKQSKTSVYDKNQISSPHRDLPGLCAGLRPVAARISCGGTGELPRQRRLQTAGHEHEGDGADKHHRALRRQGGTAQRAEQTARHDQAARTGHDQAALRGPRQQRLTTVREIYRLRQEAARQQEPGLAETLHGLRDRDARTRLRGGGSTQAGALLRRPLQPV